MTSQNAASHLGLFCLLGGISSKREIKKNTPNTPKNESGLNQLIMMGLKLSYICAVDRYYTHASTIEASNFPSTCLLDREHRRNLVLKFTRVEFACLVLQHLDIQRIQRLANLSHSTVSFHANEVIQLVLIIRCVLY